MANTINPRMGCWIKYQLNLRNLNFEAVAQKANVDASMISHFLRGRKKSDKVKKALAEILGYKSFDALIAASKKEAV